MNLLRPYGVIDTSDNSWIGDGQGPFSYPSLMFAKAAAFICSERCNTIGRFRARLLPNTDFRYKDTFTPKLSFEQVWERIMK